MKELCSTEVDMVGGGLLGITEIAAGLEATSVLGAVTAAFAAGYAIGTGIDKLNTFIAGETLGETWYRAIYC